MLAVCPSVGKNLPCNSFPRLIPPTHTPSHTLSVIPFRSHLQPRAFCGNYEATGTRSAEARQTKRRTAFRRKDRSGRLGLQRLEGRVQVRTLGFREAELLPHMRPSDRACFRSQSSPRVGAWLAAVPTDPGTTLHMHVALRRRLRLALPLTHRYCGGDGFPGCGAVLDVLGDHAAACPRSGLLARRAPLLEQAWARVARSGLGPEGRVVRLSPRRVAYNRCLRLHPGACNNQFQPGRGTQARLSRQALPT